MALHAIDADASLTLGLLATVAGRDRTMKTVVVLPGEGIGLQAADHMGLGAEARRLGAAVARVYRDAKTLTPDQGGRATTKDMAQAVLEAYRNV